MRLTTPGTAGIDQLRLADASYIGVSQTASNAVQGTTSSAGTAPAAGKRWLVTHIGLDVATNVGGLAGDRARGYAFLQRGGVSIPLFGVELASALAGACGFFSGTQAEIVVLPSDSIRVTADGQDTQNATVTVAARLTVIEYDEA